MNDFFEDIPRTVAQRRQLAERLAAEYALQNGPLNPVTAKSRNICKNFWGKAWCRNVEQYQEYESRLPAGRSYLKNGAVIDLQLIPGEIRAVVAGQEIYHVNIRIAPLAEEKKEYILKRCAGRISTLADLVSGELSGEILELLCDPVDGIFPAVDEISFDCNCPDWSEPCKHAAAALYGAGVRLDVDPVLFFTLRQIEVAEFFRNDVSIFFPAAEMNIDPRDIASVFDIELD